MVTFDDLLDEYRQWTDDYRSVNANDTYPQDILEQLDLIDCGDAAIELLHRFAERADAARNQEAV